MPRLLLVLVVLGSVLALAVWTLRRARRPQLDAAPTALNTAPAVLAFGPEQGAGVLRLTPTQLIFSAASGRMVVIERLDIIGATITTQLPDRTTAAPALAVTTGQDVYYFQIDRPERWLRGLT